MDLVPGKRNAYDNEQTTVLMKKWCSKHPGSLGQGRVKYASV